MSTLTHRPSPRAPRATLIITSSQGDLLLLHTHTHTHTQTHTHTHTHTHAKTWYHIHTLHTSFIQHTFTWANITYAKYRAENCITVIQDKISTHLKLCFL